MKQSEQGGETHVPISWEQIKEILRARRIKRARYEGHRSGKGRYTKPTMSKAERRKKRKQSRKRRKEKR